MLDEGDRKVIVRTVELYINRSVDGGDTRRYKEPCELDQGACGTQGEL
jgi:hypothetical protein